MIGALTGTITNPHVTPSIMMVAGVGYEVSLLPRLAASLTSGSHLDLRIHTVVKDDAIELYGFGTDEELRLFRLVLSVSGIGPKTALAIVNQTVPAVLAAVRKGDVDFFTAIPRLGKKNAQKVIIELKPKLGDMSTLDLGTESESQQDIIDALISMGFRKPEILAALQSVDSTLTPETKLRLTLKKLGK